MSHELDNTRAIALQPAQVFEAAGLLEAEDHQTIPRFYRSIRNIAALSALTIATAAGTWDTLNQSGDFKNYLPTIDQPVAITNEVRIGSENTAGRAAELAGKIAKWIHRRRLNYVFLQEVTTQDAGKLAEDFPSWDIAYVLADRRQHYSQGGYGNVIMSQQIPRHITTRSIAGTSTADTAVRLFASIPVNVANLDFSYTAWQEDRSALAVSSRAMNGDKMINIRLVDGHISGHRMVHKRQLREFIKFIGENTAPGQPTFVCADFNGNQHEVTSALKRKGFITPPKHSTHPTNNGDFCAVHPSGLPGKMSVNMVTDFKTDHYPNVATLIYPGPTVQLTSVGGFAPGTFK